VPAERVPRKLARTRIELEPGFVYLLDGDGDVARLRAGARPGARPRKLLRLGLERCEGYLYFIDGDGDVSRAALPEPAR
jgi:hypothetical protein